ncbi:COG3178: Predicted phosphotransferase related to Ser/Thr protein kinases [Polaromonas sp. CG9_12]|nr:COG3178: Predicted phosphotransferase related to Ser/Thr protein kinases [Polaromonas sp. CG9_12]
MGDRGKNKEGAGCVAHRLYEINPFVKSGLIIHDPPAPARAGLPHRPRALKT